MHARGPRWHTEVRASKPCGAGSGTELNGISTRIIVNKTGNKKQEQETKKQEEKKEERRRERTKKPKNQETRNKKQETSKVNTDGWIPTVLNRRTPAPAGGPGCFELDRTGLSPRASDVEPLTAGKARPGPGCRLVDRTIAWADSLPSTDTPVRIMVVTPAAAARASTELEIERPLKFAPISTSGPNTGMLAACKALASAA